MKRILTLGVLLLCLTATQTAHAAEDRNAKIKAEMIQNYLLWEIAYKIRDVERMISFQSPEFTHVMLDGTIRPKTESDAEARFWMNRIRKVHDAKVRIKKINIEPHRVVIWSVKEIDADIHAASNSTKAGATRISVIGTSRDTWVRYRDNWVLKRIENLTAKASIAGGPMVPVSSKKAK